jgi:hypothetical protein
MSFNSPRNLAPTSKVIDALATTTSAPAVTEKGLHTGNHQYLHLVFVPTGGTSAGLTLWVQYPGLTTWAVFTDFGTAGTLVLTTANGVQYVTVPIYGVDKVFVQTSANTGPVTFDLYAGANSEANE